MFTKKSGPTPARRPITALLLAGLMMMGGTPASFGGLLPPPPTLPPLPPIPPLPIPPLPIDLPLGPPELPTIPSIPQILPSNAPPPSGSTELPVTTATIDAKLLVISGDGTEPVLGAIRQAADYLGIPYTLYVASRSPGGFTPTLLSDGAGHAYYQGVVMTTGSLAWFDGTNWTSGFNATEWQTLWDYQAKYRVRTAIGYVFPTLDYGYGAATGVDTTTSPIAATLTASGRPVFPYVNASNPLSITKAWTYLAPATGNGTTVLLTDAAQHALMLVRNYPDGRQVLSTTFDGNFFLVHSLALGYGMINWVTGGLFVGQRHTYATAQIDDIFLDNDLYGGGTYRITGLDWSAVTAWQAAKQALGAQTNGLRLHIAFNGEGTTGTYFPDTLTPAGVASQSQFPWINHTWSHENLDTVGYDQAWNEISRNNQKAAALGFGNYDRRALVTPDISGLSNPDAMSAAYDTGVRFVVSDTSRPGMDNPTPQTGVPNFVEPRILMIPRRPVNLYYNVSTPAQWTAEYNSIYHAYWGRDLTYSEILDKESDVLLQYMLRGEIDPWMFHQANLRAYDGTRTLLGDLLDRVIGKFTRLSNLPILSPNQVDLGKFMKERMQFNAGGVRASIAPADGTVTLSAASPVVVPVTGLCKGTYETYGGQCISRVSLGAGQSVTLTLN
ncbi:MAG TPA: hypothetical protein VJV75_13795 [Candidatus Polarisedimenticolia bacterium]|nr:hypothetical protein [Candidatus Polarisedimenticolia bacterium]